jgi:signal transduction histidine kinase
LSERATGRPRGLFRRIFLTFVITVLVSTAVSAAGAFAFATRFSTEWVSQTMAIVDEHQDALSSALARPDDLAQEVATLAEALDARVAVYGRRGKLLAGHGPRALPGHVRAHRRELRHGKPVLFAEGRLRGPGVAVGLHVGEVRRPAAVLVVFPDSQPRLGLPLVTFALVLAVLGGGAWILSRALAEKLSRLEASAGRIARGDLRHRVPVPSVPVDEIDELGVAFNEMAEKVQTLLRGQKALLANVSHELRTPLARIKVLLEILEERADAAAKSGSTDTQRVRTGLAEMGEDVAEIEALISDLLTGGRLELQNDAGVQLELAAIDLPALLTKIAGKVGADVEVSGDPHLRADPMLLERLLSNLLANARRACPEGRIVVAAATDEHDVTELSVTDEGPGVAPSDRDAIFEPFRRLDAARDRDRGGVGLGLYLCRQVALAHGGTIVADDRLDGRPGARFVVRLPAAGPRSTAA